MHKNSKYLCKEIQKSCAQEFKKVVHRNSKKLCRNSKKLCTKIQKSCAQKFEIFVHKNSQYLCARLQQSCAQKLKKLVLGEKKNFKKKENH